MHELSLCSSIFGIVDGARGSRSVETVYLQVGQLRQVVPDTLVYCWDLVTEQTPLAGSRLDIDHVQVELLCGECQATTCPENPFILVCRRCKSAAVSVTRGKEFMVTAMDVRDDAEQGDSSVRSDDRSH